MRLSYKHMNVVDTLGEYVNIQCISEDCAMGAGVVVAYNKVMPELKQNCIEYMRNPLRNEKGLVLPFKYTSGTKEIYNMFTKEKYWHNAYKGMTYNEYIRRLKVSIEFIRDDMIRDRKTKLAMPKIGSGRDRLEWSDVERLIFETFQEIDIDILVCEFRES